MDLSIRWRSNPSLVPTALLLLMSFFPSLAGASLLGGEQVRGLIAGAPGEAEYPEAGAIILYDHSRLTIRPDHGRSLEQHLLVKILKDRGRRFGDQKRMFDATRDSVSILVARTWLADGGSVPVEDKAINVITPPELVGAAIYADVKQKVISFPSIAPGVVVELVVRTDSRPDTAASKLRPYWDLRVFQEDEPVLARVYELVTPPEFPEPGVYTANGLTGMTVSVGDGARIRRWEMRDIPMINRIPDMPPVQVYAPWLLFSNVETWEDLGRWLAGKFYPAAEPDEAVRARAAELTRGAADAADSVRAIYLFVAKNVRNIPLPLGLAGWSPHPAPRVLENMYGEQLDKAVLLSSLLSAAGFENYPALTGGDQIDVSVAGVPAAIQFGRVAVYVPGVFHDTVFANPLYDGAARNGLWLVPSARYNRYGYFNSGQGSRALVILPSGGTLFHAGEFPPEKSLSLSMGRLELSSEGDVIGEFETLADGLFDAQARSMLMDLTPVELEKTFLQAANAIAEGARLTGKSLSDLRDPCLPARASLSFEAPELGVVQGDMMIVRLPGPPFSFAAMPYFPQLREREYDFVAQGPFVLSSEIKVQLPEGWKVAFSPQTSLEEGPFGNWITGCLVRDSELVVTRRLTVSARRVELAGYEEFRRLLEKYSLPEHRLILLERAAAKAP